MKKPGSLGKKSRKSLMSKEFLTGLLAIVLGVYNILTYFGYITKFVNPPLLVGNVLLVLAGLFLWVSAYKISRYKYHSSRIF